MPLPHFTNDEQYLINCVKSPTASTSASAYMWGYIVTGALIAGFSAWKEDTLEEFYAERYGKYEYQPEPPDA